MKARIIVFGNVQGVGLRAYVKQIARNMQLRGIARNLPDGSVEIYVQAAKAAIKNFIKKIDIKGKKGKPFSLHVEKIIVIQGDSKNFVEPASWPEFFEIDYGAKLSAGEREMVEKTEFASLILTSMNDTLSWVDEKADTTNSKLGRINCNIGELKDNTKSNFSKLDSSINGLRVDTKSNFSKLDSSINGLRVDTKSNFSKLDRTYGRISGEMRQINRDINTNLKEFNKNLTKLIRVAVLRERNKIY